MKRLLFLVALLTALIGVFFVKQPTIETSLFALVGEGEIKMHPEVLERGSGEIQVLFLAKTMEDALPIANAFEARLERNAFKQIRFKLDGETSQQVLDFYKANPTGLLAPNDEQLLSQANYSRLRKNASRRWHNAILSFYTFDEDPFYLLNNFISSRPLSMSGWKAEFNGVLSTKTPDGIAILLSLSLEDTIASNPDALMPIVEHLKTIAAELNSDAVTISISGVPLHTVEVAGKCKREILWLSIFSLVVILITAWWALKSFRVYPYLLYVLSVAGMMGALVTLLCCTSIHLLAGAFATTLLGLTIDYAFHGLLTNDLQQMRKNLFASWITTEISLLPLLFSGMPILVQSAIFMMTGLATTFFTVLLTIKHPFSTLTTPATSQTPKQWRLLRAAPFIVACGILPCCAWLQFGTDLGDFHSPSKALLAAEKRFHDLTFPNGEQADAGILTVEGATIEALLEREEALELPENTPRISNFLPSFKKRQRAYEQLQQLYATEGARLATSFGLEALPAIPKPVAWTTENIPALFQNNFFIQTAEGSYLTIIPNIPRPQTLGEGVYYYQPQRVMQQTIDSLGNLTGRLLGVVCLVLFIVLAVIFRKRMFKIALPSLLAVAVVFICFGTRGQTINLFHLLSCFMLIGMSLDYTIFFASGDARVWKPVTCSFLTSLAGFGALAALSFMVIRSIGQVFAVGLPVAYCTAWVLFWRAPQKHSAPSTPSGEVAASTLGLNCVMLLYRLLGKWALDCSGYVIANTLWLTSAKIRRFTQTRQRLIAFIQSMVDKFVVMSCGRGQPTIEIATDAQTQAFISDVTARKGVFLLSSHFGAMEVLPAIQSTDVPLHAFMHIEHTAVFNKFYFKHFKRPSVHIRPITGFGMGELFEAGNYLDNGECILMAGDRTFGTAQTVSFLGRDCPFPKGVYRFAKLLEHPIYFVVCYRIRRQVYRLEARSITPSDTMVEQFVAMLEPFVKAHPEQWYNWEMLP